MKPGNLIILGILTVVTLGIILITTPSSTNATGGYSEPAILGIPSENLPYCSDTEAADFLFNQPIPASTLSAPDFSSTQGCRIHGNDIVVIGDARKTLSRSPDSPAPFWAPDLPSAYAWAVSKNVCCSTQNDGITGVASAITTQVPTIPSGHNWNNYHFYNRMHVANRFEYSSNCGGYVSMSAGIAKGNIGGTVFNNELITERLLSSGCLVHSTGLIFQPPGAVYILMHADPGTTLWRVLVWLGQWVQVDNYNMGFTSSTWTEHGQEIRAASGASALGNVTLPLSFTHKVRVKSAVTGNYYPWNDLVLPWPLVGNTTSQADWPFHVLDLVGGDYTSMASCTNCTN